MELASEKPITNADRTFYQLRKDIVEGVIEAGSKLSETELSTKYSVSRAVIREAINRLMSCHLVERKANVGARVVALTLSGLAELYQVREALEGMAARQAARSMPEAEIAELQILMNDHFERVKSGDTYYQEAGDVDFHYRIILGSKNQHLISILIDGLYHLVRMYRVQLGMAGPRVTTAYDEHRNIVQAIANRDEELAELLMRRHILYSRNNIENKLRLSPSTL
ncbi:GntR family transcriptional regulator [Alteromonas aestuariivivens]|uniref:GntR family transcriptional regulator n=1 Tax=Alteromonas aestuariivivens TaxID=1938339 RepID=A0A3D8MDS6_9ALTE|nr:GntR family transcriptional regulator [Alteromonas aestuariivivens]RDV28995.1 GntR family transcriptional regulator [Alteromonas aestuariivivens]